MNKREIRDIERTSIRNFVSRQDVYLWGRVLDFGCGKPDTCVQPQPYRGIVNSIHQRNGTGTYVPYDLGFDFPDGVFDTVLMTQVMQYVPDPPALLQRLRRITKYLVMTYPTHWEEVERSDRWRFTKLGMEDLLRAAGFTVLIHEARWSLPFDDFRLIGGYGVVAE